MRPKILIVDDDFERYLKPFWQLALEGQGLEYEYALSGKEGLIKLVKSKPQFDALVTDLSMPGPINGIELLRQVSRYKIVLRSKHLLTSHVRGSDPLSYEVCQRLEAQHVTIWHKKDHPFEALIKKIREELGS